ncbi:MAG: type II secretion system protein, partial [Burkholderiales bacterium]|nr:type II secretion system protein [Burkholderiales bacterium]
AGFTLIELLVTLTLLAILATIVVPIAQLQIQRTREQELVRALRDIRNAIDAYKQAYDEGRIIHSVNATGYPPTLEILEEGLEDARDPKKRKMFFIRRIPRDPMLPENGTPPARTWGLRSYSSDLDDPQPGSDVYDIYSQSPALGLNGVPYRKW